MSKELTEKLRNGELPDGHYYMIFSGWNMQTFLSIAYYSRNYIDANVIEVLAPVPSYDEYAELTQKIGRLELDNEGLEMAHNEGVEINAELKSENKKLKEQLAEANDVIKKYAYPKSVCKSINENQEVWEVIAYTEPKEGLDYLEKWGVK